MASPAPLTELTLPLSYIDPAKKVIWRLGLDEDDRLTSVFQSLDKKTDRLIDYLTNSKALFTANELIANGWTEWKMPEITFENPDGTPVK